MLKAAVTIYSAIFNADLFVKWHILAFFCAAAIVDFCRNNTLNTLVWSTKGTLSELVQNNDQQPFYGPFPGQDMSLHCFDTVVWATGRAFGLQKNGGLILGLVRCANGCVVECRIYNREVAGSNLSLGYFAPRCTQPSIPPGSVNEYQLQLEGKGRYGSFRLWMNVWVCR